MFRTTQCILSIANLAILAAALMAPWWPASPLVKGFYEYLRRRAEVDKASLNRLRKQQREQLDRGESISPDKRIADDDVIHLPSHIIGIFERYFAFSLVLAFGLEATVGTVLIAWIGAKQFANWQRPTTGQGAGLQDQIIRAHTLIALITGTLSLFIGVLCGWIARKAGCYLLTHIPFEFPLIT